MKLTQFSPDGFPLWLYFSREDNQSPGYSPVTAFNPVEALAGNPYVGKTSPSSILNKKSLVVTAQTLASPRARAILYHLYLEGFPLLFWGKQDPILIKPEDNFFLPDIATLTTFPKKGYTELVDKYQLAYDQVEVLEGETWNDLRFALNINLFTIFEDKKSGVRIQRCNYRKFADISIGMLASLGSFCCIPGFFENGAFKPYYMCHYDSEIVRFLLEWYESSSQFDKLYINFSPEILANQRILQHMCDNKALMDALSTESLCQLGEANIDIAYKILETKNEEFDVFKKIRMLGGDEELAEELPRLMMELNEDYPDYFVDCLCNFFNIKNPHAKVSSIIYDFYTAHRSGGGDILKKMPENVAMIIFERFHVDDYVNITQASLQLSYLGSEHESVARLIVDGLLNQKSPFAGKFEPLSIEDKRFILLKLGEAHRQVALHILSLSMGVLKKLFSLAEVQRLQEASMSEKEKAESWIIEQRYDKSMEEWTKVWIANPELADYIGQIIEKNKEAMPHFLHDDYAITDLEMDGFLVPAERDPIKNKTIQSLSLRPNVDSDAVLNLIQYLPSLSEIYIHIDDMNKLKEQNIELTTGREGIAVKTFGIQSAVPEKSGSVSFEQILQDNSADNSSYNSNSAYNSASLPDLGFLYTNSSGSGQPALLTALENDKHCVFFNKPLFAIVDPARRTEAIQKKLTDMMRMSWEQIYVYSGNKPQLVESPRERSVTVPIVHSEGGVEFSMISIDLLKRTGDGGYLVPVLTKEQQLTSCVGGEIKKDAFGRWIFYADAETDIQNCQLRIAIPPDVLDTYEEEYLHEGNIDDSRWSSVSEIGALRRFFSVEYNENNKKNCSCEARVRNLLKKKPKDAKWFYGIGGCGSHAYLVIQDANNSPYRVDLGGSSNFSEIYAPVSAEVKEKLLLNSTVAADDGLLSVPKEEKTEIQVRDILARSENQKILFQAPESFVSPLIEWGKNQGETVMVINNFFQFDFDKKTLKIHANKSISYEEHGFLADFLNQATDNPDEPFRLIVLWDHFSSSERLRVNTLLEKTIQNRAIPDNVRIIGITQKDIVALKEKDDSFSSRHNCCEVVSDNMREVFEQDVGVSTRVPLDMVLDVVPGTIDLCGYSDWKAALLGPVKMQCNQMYWEPTKFAQTVLDSLESTERHDPQTLNLLHIPEKHRAAAQEYIARSRALGYFFYHGLSIPFPSNLDMRVSNQRFDFRRFSPESIQIRPFSLSESPAESVVWVNTHVFDHLLQQKYIDEELGEYSDVVGAIEEAKDKGQKLTVKVTSSLSESQWYCLLSEAEKHGVVLTVELAAGVSMLAALKKNNDEVSDLWSPDEKHRIDDDLEPEAPLLHLPKVYLSNDVNALCDALGYADTGDTYIFDVEDFSYQDLFFDETHKMQGGKFTSFSCQLTDILRQLASGKNVVLKGEFSEVLLAYLHRILATGRVEQSGQVVTIKGKLTLIIEKPELTDSNAPKILEKSSLSWVPGIECHYQSTMPKHVLPDKFEPTNKTIDWSTLKEEDLSEIESTHFLNTRKAFLLTELARHACVVLTGPTGVGKSRLMQLIHAPENGCIVYHTVEDFLAANRDKPGTKRVLFLDEYNLQNKHLTFLAPLFGSDRPRLLFKGKIYQLEKDDKVVLAGNPLDYGSGRVKQKLFERYSDKIQQIKLSDFPPAYIYQEILLPLYQKSSARIKNSVSETAFRATCLQRLQTYGLKKSQESETVRKLQEDVLIYLLQQYKENNPFLRGKSVSFIPKKYHHEYKPEQLKMMQHLQDKLEVRRQQILGNLPSQGLGLNGMLLLGESGVGKTTAIEEVLHEKDTSDYIKIDASLSLSKQEELILEGFRDGKILWIDEINSLLEAGDKENDDYLEKWINAILTGEDPETGLPVTAETDPKTGLPLTRQCVLIVTANKADREGRSILSPAIRARLTDYEVTLTENFRLQKTKPIGPVEVPVLPTTTVLKLK